MAGLSSQNIAPSISVARSLSCFAGQHFAASGVLIGVASSSIMKQSIYQTIGNLAGPKLPTCTKPEPQQHVQSRRARNHSHGNMFNVDAHETLATATFDLCSRMATLRCFSSIVFHRESSSIVNARARPCTLFPPPYFVRTSTVVTQWLLRADHHPSPQSPRLLEIFCLERIRQYLLEGQELAAIESAANYTP